MPAQRVLVLVEDVTFGEVLCDALRAAGHDPFLIFDDTSDGRTLAALPLPAFDAALVDLDTRAHRRGDCWVALVRRHASTVRVVALLPCGGPLPGPHRCHFDAALEKPARIDAVLGALGA